MGNDAPNSQKMNVNVDGESAFEFIRLIPSSHVVPCIHLVRKGYLLEIPRKEKADLFPESRYVRPR
jgi:hypothetical protein